MLILKINTLRFPWYRFWLKVQNALVVDKLSISAFHVFWKIFPLE